MRTLLVAVVAVFLFALFVPVASAASFDFTTSKNSFNLIRGTSGEKLGTITYSGSFTPDVEWDDCRLIVDMRGYPVAGLRAENVSQYCRRSGGTIEVTVTIAVKGVYEGGNITWNPFSVVAVELYNNGSRVDVVYASVQTISINEVIITRLDFGSPAIDTGSVSYVVIPDTLVEAGTSIYIVTSADVNAVIELSNYVSVPTNLYAVYSISRGGGSSYRTVPIYISTDTLSVSFKLRDIPLDRPLSLTIEQNNLTVYAGTLDVPSKAEEIDVGYVALSTFPPVQFWESRERYKVVSQVYITQITSGRVDVSMTVNGANTPTRSYTAPGPTDDLYVTFDERQDTISGEYRIVYHGRYGSSPTIVVKFSDQYTHTVGGLLKGVFEILFTFSIGAGFVAVVLGLFLRRPDLQSSGLIVLASSVMIFLIPTLMGYIIALVVHAGLEDPIGLSDLNLVNLGDKVDASISFIYHRAQSYSMWLMGASVAAITFAIALAGLTVVGGAIGIFTGGALSIFLGNVLGKLGSFLITFAVMSFIASVILRVIGVVFPVLLTVIFVIILFVALLNALFAGFTGSYAQIYTPVISLAILVMAVLLTPPVIATLDKIQMDYQISIHIPVIDEEIPIPTDIFMFFGLVLMKIIILVSVLAMAFQRLLATLAGAGQG